MCPLDPEVCFQPHTDGGVLPGHGEEMKLANSGQLAGATLIAQLLGAQPSLVLTQQSALLADAAS